MSIAPSDITIAVTVYNRRDYILKAVESALSQTVPVRVMVVEDCGPDASLRDLVLAKFGDRITYYRSPVRHGLFGNWNTCLEQCPTPWLSILHDDDYLATDFIENAIRLASAFPDRGFYCGRGRYTDQTGQEHGFGCPPLSKEMEELDMNQFADLNLTLFPGTLFRPKDAKSLGGFRTTSLFCGDWEMWFNLAYHYGGARTNACMAFARSHFHAERGTTKIELRGLKFCVDFVQAKRNYHLLHLRDSKARFDRARHLSLNIFPANALLRHGAGFSPRMLKYNCGVFLQAPPETFSRSLLKGCIRLLGWRGVKLCSQVYRAVKRR
ncbi:MAG: glycosyltransferase family 2 protein [Verrucomicrobiota bacterium]